MEEKRARRRLKTIMADADCDSFVVVVAGSGIRWWKEAGSGLSKLLRR